MVSSCELLCRIIDQHNSPTYIITMKPIQIMINEDLLDALDRDEEVQRIGRSAVFRSIVTDYLDRRRRAVISAGYKQAYGREDDTPYQEELSGWEEEGVWPER